MELLLAAFGLGLAAIDILGVLIVTSALSAGASKRSIAGFAATVFIGTVLLGTFLSLFLGSSVSRITEFVNALPSYVWVPLYFVAALLLLAWAFKRIVKSPKTKKPEEEKSGLLKWFKYGLFVVGILFVISALTDPSYLALIAIAGHNGHTGTIVAAHAIWILVSQVPLFIFVGAVLLNKHQGLMGWFRGIQKKYSQQLSLLLTIAITVAGLVLLADVITFLVTQAWLFG